MDSPLIGLRTAAVVFAVVAILQLARLVMHFEITVEGHILPFWPNAVACVIAAGLSAWMWRLATVAKLRGTH